MRPPPGVTLTPRPDRSEPDELVVEISIDVDVEPFRAAMEATAGAIRALSEGIRNRDAVVLQAIAQSVTDPAFRSFARRMAQREQALASLQAVVRPEEWEAAQAEAARRGAMVGDEIAGIRSLITDASMGVWPPNEDVAAILARAASQGSVMAAELRSALDEVGLPLTMARTVADFGATVAPEQVDDGQAHDYDPDRCWKCDAKPGVEELDGACWRCWYKLTGSTKAGPA